MISCVQLFVNSWNVLGMPIICSISSKKLIHWYFRGGGLLVGGNHIRDREYWSSLSSRRILSYRSCRAKTMSTSMTTCWKYGEWINTQGMLGPQNEFLFFEISPHTSLCLHRVIIPSEVIGVVSMCITLVYNQQSLLMTLWNFSSSLWVRATPPSGISPLRQGRSHPWRRGGFFH